MNTFDFVAVPIIVSVVYACVGLLKKETHKNEKIMSKLPIIAAILGSILGIIAFFAVPDLIPAENAFVALLVGGASGLAATGTNQIFKQLGKGKEDESKNDGNGGG